MTLLNSTAQDYLELIQEPKLRIGARGAELINLTRLFDQAMALLYNKLDKLMPIFRNTNPTLYDEYLFARGIDDTGSPSLPDYEANIPGNSIQLVADIPYSMSRSFRVRNTGTTTLVFSLSNTAGVLQGNAATILPGAEINNATPTLNNDNSATKLVLQNTEAPVGSYKIWITE
ncbi:MAG: hypothetical protein V4613_07625 [Bacteroidota bacterium]